MPNLKVKTVESEEVWSKGDLTISKVVFDYNGQKLTAKTYSKAIAKVGWEGEVESYEKEGRNGSETFVKQPQDTSYQTNKGGGRSSYQPKDEKAIQAMWAIGQAVQLVIADENKGLGDIEDLASTLFDLIDVVKASKEPGEKDSFSQEVSDSIDKTVAEVFPDSENFSVEGEETPWPTSQS